MQSFLYKILFSTDSRGNLLPIDDINEKYRHAGLVAAKAEQHARKITKPGIPFKKLANQIEAFILENDAGLSFPVNLSLNDCAAHYSPGIDDGSIVPDEGLLKIDIGTHVDGYIADHAFTLDLAGGDGENQRLIQAAEDALAAAINAFTPGNNVIAVGRVINDTIRAAGFRPISNLGGHNLERYSLHGGIFVPNMGSGMPYMIKAGDVFAIEPFATNGHGIVVDGTVAFIYKFEKRPRKTMPMRLQVLMEKIRKQFTSLPFSPRWLEESGKEREIIEAVKQLHQKNVLHSYPLLMERGGGLVSQAEHTVIVHPDHTEITTILK